MSFENTFEYFGGIDRLDTLRQIVPQVSCCRLKRATPIKYRGIGVYRVSYMYLLRKTLTFLLVDQQHKGA